MVTAPCGVTTAVDAARPTCVPGPKCGGGGGGLSLMVRVAVALPRVAFPLGLEIVKVIVSSPSVSRADGGS
jgi:hypothetical protein